MISFEWPQLQAHWWLKLRIDQVGRHCWMLLHPQVWSCLWGHVGCLVWLKVRWHWWLHWKLLGHVWWHLLMHGGHLRQMLHLLHVLHLLHLLHLLHVLHLLLMLLLLQLLLLLHLQLLVDHLPKVRWQVWIVDLLGSGRRHLGPG